MSGCRVWAVALGMTVLVCGCSTPGTPAPVAPDVAISQSARGVEIHSANTILFDSGKYDIKLSARPFLDQVARLLQSRPHSKVLIEGHTDSVGGRELNQDLSELRALSVMKALVDRGVSKTRITASGYGMTRPLADNATEAGRQKNRRTDIILLGETRDSLRQENSKGMLDGVLEFGRGLFR